MVGRHICQAPEDRDWSIFSPKENPELAHTLVPLLISYYQNQITKPRPFPLMLETAGMSLKFLQESVGREEAIYAVQRIGNFVTTTVREFVWEDFRIQPITGVAHKQDDGWDVEKSEKRIALYRELFEEMLEHQSLAEQAFEILKRNTELLKLRDDDLFEFANRALVHLPAERFSLNTISKVPALNRGGRLNATALASERKVGSLHYLLSQGRIKEREIFTPAALAFLEKNQPVRYKSYRTAREICEASPDESGALYQGWLQGLPKEDREKNKAIGELSWFLVSFASSDRKWVDDHQELVVTSMSDSFQSNSWRTGWGNWILKEKGRVAFYDLIDRVCEVILGDRKKWAVISRLPSHHWPKDYRDKIQKLSRALQVFTCDARLVEPVASAIRKIGLERIQTAPLTNLRAIWTKQIKTDPEVQMQWFRENGGLKRSSAKGVEDPARLLVFCEAIRFLKPSKKSNNLAILGTKLDEDEGLDPMMKDLLRARLGLDVDVHAILEERLGKIEAMAELSTKEVATLVLEWFSAFETSGAKSGSAAFVKKLGREMRKSAYVQIVGEAELHGGAIAYLKTQRSWLSLERVAGHSPVEAARAFEKLLIEIQELSTGSRRYRSKIVDKFVQSMLEVLGKPSSKVSVERRVKFVHRLFNGLLKDQLQMPGFSGRTLSQSMRSDLDEIVESRMKEDPFSGSIRLCTSALLPYLEKLGPAERQTFLMSITLAFFDGWEGKRGEKELGEFRWLNEEVRANYPVSVDFLCAVFSPSFGSREKNEPANTEALDQGAESLLRFMESNELSSGFRMKLGFQLLLYPRYRRLLSTPRHWDFIARWIDDYETSAVREQSEIVSNLAGSLVVEDFQALKFIPKAFLDVMTDALLRQKIDQEAIRSYQKSGAAKMVTIALGVGDLENARRLIEAYPKSFQGNLSLLWELFEAGEEDLVSRIFDPGTQTFTESRAFLFGKGTSEKLDRFLTLFPRESRFYLEFLIAGRSDASGGDAPAKRQSARILELAARFSKEGPKSGLRRLHLLSVFATIPGAEILVGKELLLVEKKHRLGFLHRSGGGSGEETFLRTIIKSVISQEISEGKFVSAKRQYQSICGSASPSSALVEDGVEIIQAISLNVWDLSIKDGAHAKGFRALADFFFQETLRLEVKDGVKLIGPAEGFAFLQHLLAEDEAGWDAVLEGLGRKAKARYAGVIAKKSLTARIQKIKSLSWKGDDQKGMRLALQQALWASKRFQMEAQERPGYTASYLTAHGLALTGEINSLLSEIPKGLDRAHFFLWQKAVTSGAKEETLKWFEDARKVAREKGESELESEILTDHVARLMELDRKEDALKLAKEVDPGLLHRPDRRKLITDLLREKE